MWQQNRNQLHLYNLIHLPRMESIGNLFDIIRRKIRNTRSFIKPIWRASINNTSLYDELYHYYPIYPWLVARYRWYLCVGKQLPR